MSVLGDVGPMSPGNWGRNR